ncbi:MAG: ATP-binding cassette domain-containing protein [Bacillota bacterium]|nr:ATP-binding cassette domain-containing protein [Bacillota bacterium]
MNLRVENLSARYSPESKTIFEGISFEVKAGEFILLTGLSGSGKSTLLSSLNGILHGEELVSGSIFLDDTELSGMGANERSNYIASVLQNADEQIIFEKVEDELAFPLENMALSPEEMRERIQKYAGMMSLRLNDRTSKLSGGQKQSLITAASFGMERKILLFDEPLANLDNRAAVRLLDTLKEFCEKHGYIVLFSEHRIDLVLGYTDRVFYMNAGKLKSISDKTRFKLYLDNKVSKIKETLVSTCKEPVFEIDRLQYKVDSKEILKGINYKFLRGGKYVISGENGTGKTTFIKLLTGINKPSAGSIRSPFSKKERFQKIGLVMQNPNYQLFMPSVEAELKLQSKDDNFLQFLIENFRIGELLQKHPHSLSEGQKRRVGVAAILSMQPEVLILDEPSVGQDYKNMSAMLTAILELCKINDTTVISISHDLRCFQNLGDIFLKLEDGVLKENEVF